MFIHYIPHAIILKECYCMVCGTAIVYALMTACWITVCGLISLCLQSYCLCIGDDSYNCRS